MITDSTFRTSASLRSAILLLIFKLVRLNSKHSFESKEISCVKLLITVFSSNCWSLFCQLSFLTFARDKNACVLFRVEMAELVNTLLDFPSYLKKRSQCQDFQSSLEFLHDEEPIQLGTALTRLFWLHPQCLYSLALQKLIPNVKLN